MENARLRVRADDRAGVAGRVPIGTLVRVYEQTGDWALVAAPPDGPAGYLSAKLLDGRKPLALLAQEQAFERCGVEEDGTVDDCLFSAKQQEQPCLDRCGAVTAGDESERLRCAGVCNIAFDRCARSCRQQEARLGKGKRRRR